MFPCRLILDEPAQGAWNMAVDEALLESAANEEICSLRFYGWSEPTLSLGYFQRYADRQHHHPSRDCLLVRRLSGGGAILHDDELTYSFAAPAKVLTQSNPQLLYGTFHRSLIEVLSTWSIYAQLWDQPSMLPADEEPFLCFQRRSVGDVVVESSSSGSIKIAGSAQRRRRGAILQHGSLLFHASIAAPELPGLDSVMDQKPPNRHELLARWPAKLELALGLSLTAGQHSPRETARARTLAAEKYDSAIWNERK
jgi:lipoate-protein ligase A